MEALILLLPLFPALLQAATASPGAQHGLDNETALRVSKAVAGRTALVELVQKDDRGQELVVRSSPAVVVGAKHLMTIAPWLGEGQEAPATGAPTFSKPARWLSVLHDDGTGKRRLAARVVQSDAQTGLTVLLANELRGTPLSFNPLPVLAKETPVVLAQLTAGGRLTLRTAKVRQGRALLDQGRGKNPLLLFNLDDSRLEAGYSCWEDYLATLSGAFLTDLSGGFLGIVTPPHLEVAASGLRQGGKKLRPDSKPSLKEGEVLALPAEIARLLSEPLTRGKQPVRGYFGASFREVRDPPEEARRLGSARPGVRVEKVYPGGPADQGGLRSGDWLVAIAEKKGVSYSEVVRFSELVEYTGHGKVIHLQVVRPGESGLQLLRLQIRIGTR